jgi:hypothetical protein
LSIPFTAACPLTGWLHICHYRRPGVKSSGIRIRPFALQYVYMPWAKAYGRQVMGVGVGDLDNAKRRLPRACLCWPAASSFTPVRDMSIHRFGLASPSVAGWATRASWSLPSADLHATVSISLVGLKRAVPIARPELCILVHSHFRYNVLSGICTLSTTSDLNLNNYSHMPCSISVNTDRIHLVDPILSLFCCACVRHIYKLSLVKLCTA